MCTNVVKYTILKLEKIPFYSRNRIHERTISLRFLGIILKVLRLEVSLYNVYITKQFQSFFAQGVEGGKSVGEVTARRKTLETFVPISLKNSASGQIFKDDVNGFSSTGYLLHDVYASSIAGEVDI